MEFEWDEAKAAANERKHGVTFAEAAPTFADPLAALFPILITPLTRSGNFWWGIRSVTVCC